MESLLTYLEKLIAYPSITPNDAGCQNYLIERLESLGFVCTRYDHAPVTNFYAQYGKSEPLLLFAGHTDVVSPGNLAAWSSPPFELQEKQGRLYGRGIADMKGAIAAMLSAIQTLLDTKGIKGSLGLLITSGEEGDDFLKGTPWVMKAIKERGIHPTFCIVGEPSSEQSTGDCIKIGRRGSLNASLLFQGKQGHVAYPHLADNPIHRVAPFLSELAGITLDEGNEYFPPSSLQMTTIRAGGQGNNVIPGELMLSLNIRYNNLHHSDDLKQYLCKRLEHHQLFPKITWQLSGEPFLTPKGQLLEATLAAIHSHTGRPPVLSTHGGTSDGRFIAPYGIEVIELGLPCHSIHQINEYSTKQDLDKLEVIYRDIIDRLLN